MRIIVIGASHAGIAFVDAMRRNGFAGELVLLDRQVGQPMERPPLSKAFLAGDGSDDSRFALRKSDWFAANDIQLFDNCQVTAIDTATQEVETGTGDRMRYDRLVLAMGATPRRLAATKDIATEGKGGVFELRHPDDAARLRSAAAGAASAIVIGGGYIGLEVAATLTKSGKRVTVIEAAPRLLARVASPLVSDFFAGLHGEAGTEVITDIGVEDVVASDGRFSHVALSDGRQLAADMLVVGIGVLPEMALAETAGIETGNGILVDAAMQTSVEGVHAIGDGALVRDSAYGIRIESVHNAQDSAERAAAAINGHAPPADQAPWFWSEQFGLRLQSAGIVPPPADDVTYLRRPGKREGGFSIWSYEGEALCAVEAVADPAGYMLGKTCLERGVSPPREAVTDPQFDLKAFVAAN